VWFHINFAGNAPISIPIEQETYFSPLLYVLNRINMELKEIHKRFCREYMISLNAKDSYLKCFKTSSAKSAGPSAHNLLKKQEIKDYIDKLKRDKEKQMQETRKQELELIKEQVLTEIELDFFHSQVLRGEIMVEEVIPTREYVPVEKDDKGNVILGTGRWAVSFKSVRRKPNIREMQISADQLYRRKGSYAAIKIKPTRGDNDDDIIDETPQPAQRFILLSNGERLPLNET
jgi:hypothetical protein